MARRARQAFPNENAARAKAMLCVSEGIKMQKNSKYSKALACYDDAINAYPAFVDGHGNRGALLAMLGRYDEALPSLERAAALLGDAEPNAYYINLHTNRAGVLMNVGRRKEAVACMDTALNWLEETTPDNDYIREMIAGCYDMLGEGAKATACRNASVGGSAMNYHNKGVMIAMKGRNKEAAACFERAVEIDPSLVESHFSMGTVMRRMGKRKQALSCFQKAAKANPSYAPAHNEIAAELNNMGRLKQALESINRALNLDPKMGVAHFGKGIILLDLGKNQEAVECFERALKLDIKEATVYICLGWAHLRLGKPQKAAESFERALKLDPQSKEARAGSAEAKKALGGRDGRRSLWDRR